MPEVKDTASPEPVWVVVETWDVKTDKTEAATTIDHGNHHSRVWLGKHCMWAVRNGKGVTIYPKLEDK